MKRITAEEFIKQYDPRNNPQQAIIKKLKSEYDELQQKFDQMEEAYKKLKEENSRLMAQARENWKTHS